MCTFHAAAFRTSVLLLPLCSSDAVLFMQATVRKHARLQLADMFEIPFLVHQAAGLECRAIHVQCGQHCPRTQTGSHGCCGKAELE
eukprot:scaffold8013_cov124-Isochrysis_galbana.AAC.5